MRRTIMKYKNLWIFIFAVAAIVIYLIDFHARTNHTLKVNLMNKSLNIRLSDWLQSPKMPQNECRVETDILKEMRFPVHDNITLRELFQGDVQNVSPGGLYEPHDCVRSDNLAVIIPYRERTKHLDILLNNLHTMLQRQKLQYGIFVVEMALPTQFNVGMLRNIGFVTAKRLGDYNCFVFNDVDLIPVNEKNVYQCSASPKHLSSNNTKYKDGIPYHSYFGGVVMFSDEQFKTVNGYSNLYFGWGGEDDDIEIRIKSKSMRYERNPTKIGTYFALPHGKGTTNPENVQKGELFKNIKERMDKDGLNSLKYKHISMEFLPLYTHILVEINESKFTNPK